MIYFALCFITTDYFIKQVSGVNIDEITTKVSEIELSYPESYTYTVAFDDIISFALPKPGLASRMERENLVYIRGCYTVLLLGALAMLPI